MLAKFQKVSEVSFHLALIISAVWVVYWLSHIESTKQVGYILAFPTQLILYSSVFRLVALAAKHVSEMPKT